LIPGVFLIVRLDDLILGIGRIHTLDSTITTKISRKCPKCLTKSLDRRKSDYRCTTCKGVFLEDQIVIATDEVISFRAYFEKSWFPAARTVTGKDVELLIGRNDKQSSIRGVTDSELEEVSKLLGLRTPEFNAAGYYEL
jgi:hypothetical protein